MKYDYTIALLKVTANNKLHCLEIAQINGGICNCGSTIEEIDGNIKELNESIRLLECVQKAS